MQFGRAKPLGKRGLHWLKVHMTNSYGSGAEKGSYDARIRFLDNTFDMVRAAALDPWGDHEHCRWWKTAEMPFQALAVATDLYSALIHPEGPELYKYGH